MMPQRRSPSLCSPFPQPPSIHFAVRPSFVLLVLRVVSPPVFCCVYPRLSGVYPFGSDDMAPHFPALRRPKDAFLKGQIHFSSRPSLGVGVLLLSKAVDFSRRTRWQFTDVSEFICSLHSWIRNRGRDRATEQKRATARCALGLNSLHF